MFRTKNWRRRLAGRVRTGMDDSPSVLGHFWVLSESELNSAEEVRSRGRFEPDDEFGNEIELILEMDLNPKSEFTDLLL